MSDDLVLLAQAGDAVQETLLRAWSDLRGLRQVDRFDAWLRRILVRCCYRAAVRRRSRHVVEIKLRWAEATVVADSQQGVAIRDQLDVASGACPGCSAASSSCATTSAFRPTECAEALWIPPGDRAVPARPRQGSDARRARRR